MIMGKNEIKICETIKCVGQEERENCIRSRLNYIRTHYNIVTVQSQSPSKKQSMPVGIHESSG